MASTLKFVVLCGLALIGGFLAFKPSLSQQIDHYLEENGFSGTALIAKEGKILHKRGYGLANREHGIINTPDTVYRIASLTKQISAIAIMQLAEKNKLDLHDTISKFLPEYPLPQGAQITIHHLLSHSSGIPSILEFPNLAEIQRHPATPQETMRHFSSLPLKFAPGTDCEYSDSGYIVLGAIIEAASKQAYADYIQENIFAPLGMNSSFYESNRLIPRRASGYVQKEGEFRHADYIDMSFPHGSGALTSTVEDLYRLGLGLKTLLSQESRDSLFKVQAANQAGTITYGYGFRIGPKNTGMEGCRSSIIGHFGGIEGFAAASIYYPDTDITIILLSNVEKMPVKSFHKELAQLISSYWRS